MDDALRRQMLLENFEFPKPSRRYLAVGSLCWFVALGASLVATLQCGQDELDRLHKGQRLHVVSNLQTLHAKQAAGGLYCGADCEEAVGKEVELETAFYQYVKVSFLKLGTEEPVDLEIAGSALQEVWCSDDDIWVLALICAILLGSSGLVLVPLFGIHQCGRELCYREAQGESDRGQCQIYAIALAGATWQYFVHTEFVVNRKMAWQYFPWIDFLIPIVGWVISIAVGGFQTSSVAPGAIIFLLTVGIRITFRIHTSLRYHRCMAKRRADLHVCAAPGVNLICIVCDGSAYYYQNIGDVNQQAPNGYRWRSSASKALARTQLIACRETQSDEDGMLSWYLKVVYAQRSNRDWLIQSGLFPVDNARVHDFQNWLSDPERRKLFRFVGATARPQNVIRPHAATLLTPFSIPPGDMRTPLSTSNLVFTADVQKVEAALYNVSLLSLSGEEAASSVFSNADTLADVLHHFASRPQYRTYQLKIFLSDGSTLDGLDPRMAVPQLFHVCQCTDSRDA